LFEAVEGDEGAVAGRPGSRTQYVGRDEELADLRKALEAADGGRGGIVLLGGEPGVGKTRLAEEIASLARRRGMLAFTGRCSDIEGAPPYLPFVEIFEAVAAFVPADALRAALGEAGGDIARVVPSLRRVVPGLPPALDLPAEQERRYLQNAVRDFLARSARMHSLVLILDDLHWADEPTLRLVEHLAEMLPELPCLVIGTYRDVELDVGRPLARTLESLLRRHLATRVSLRRLPEHGVREMLASLAQQDPPDVLVKTVFSETEGNPFFVEEVFRHLVEEGRLFGDDGRFRTDLRIDEVDVPEGVRLVIGRRLERLAEDTREILAAGAVAGRIFPYRVLAAISERPDADLLDALDEAERAHLVSSAGGREERYAFSHELVRQTLLSGLTSARRRRLHLRAADAIEEVYGDDAVAHAADMAHHLTTAGAAADIGRTARWLRLAGERALEATAFEDAVRHLEEALALEATDDVRERADVQFLLGSAQRGAGRWEDALATWKDALNGFEALGDDDRLAETAWHVGYQLLWAGRRDELVDVLARVLARLEGADSAPHARLLFGAAAGFASAGQHEGTMLMLGKADRMVEAVEDEAARRDLEQAHAFVDWTFPGLAESTRHGRRAAELMREAGALWDLANVESFVSASEMLSGNDDEARAAGERGSELADRVGHVGAHIYINRALAPLEVQRTGRLDEYVADMEREADLAREAGISWGEANAWWHAAMGELWRGRWDEARRIADTGVPPDLPAAFAGWGQGVRMLVMAHVAPAEAPEVIEEYRDGLVVPGRVGTSGAWMATLFATEALAVLGKWDRLAGFAPLLEGVDATGIVRRVVDCRTTDVSRGLVAAALGDADAAARWFDGALAHADGRGLRIEAAEVRRLFALALERLGSDADRARELRADAAARYREIGMERFTALCGD
jgi:tetratricopeptide (TPR) repeat protein